MISICLAPGGVQAYAKQSVILLYVRRDNEKTSINSFNSDEEHKGLHMNSRNYCTTENR